MYVCVYILVDVIIFLLKTTSILGYIHIHSWGYKEYQSLCKIIILFKFIFSLILKIENLI